MPNVRIDHVARVLSSPTSRRGALAALGALIFARATPAAANQLAVPACGEAGAVCTMIAGCCSGLTCATSLTNPTYGVCVSGGSGGMMPVSTNGITPASDGVATELAQVVADTAASSTTTTDLDAERQARIDAKKARKSSRRTNRKSRNATQRDSKESRRDSRRLNGAPQIELEHFAEVPADPNDPQDQGEAEMVRVRNLDDVTVVLSRIESIAQPNIASSLSVTIPAGGTYVLQSGKLGEPPQDASSGSIWTEKTVCPAGDGVTLSAAQSGSAQTHRYEVLCGESVTYASPATNNKRRKKKTQKKQAHRQAAQNKRRTNRKAKRGDG